MRSPQEVSGPDEPAVPELEEDQTIPPRPEEEIADVLRAVPDVADHRRVRPETTVTRAPVRQPPS